MISYDQLLILFKDYGISGLLVAALFIILKYSQFDITIRYKPNNEAA